MDRPAAGVSEFKQMVKLLHRAGIEVILDVVYNHTAEGNHLGPTLSFKGIDNPTYYRLVPDDPRFYFDYTGTGNSLNVRHPQTLQLIMDSLRYWVLDMHVDGFRFDLAATLARGLHEVNQLSSFFTIIHQDPVLSQVKLIAEPWDVGEGGYQVGNFPVRWTEWNGKYRDSIRSFWKGGGGVAADIGFRLSGSSDLYESDGRRPYSSINFVTAHDGFTLRDLVSYDHKHNEANGEGNQDGESENRSWNCGAEGDTDDPGVLALRRRQKRNLLATLLLSQGTPMIAGGDEIGRTQRGNNNAYCQDNELSWYDWELDDERRAFLELTSRLIRIRKEHPGLHRAKFFKGRKIRALGVTDILRAERGSTHGYNIVAHDQLHPELGDEAAFRAFVAAVREAGMGYVLDVVPNHMGVATGENAWWNDVLENGPASLYADYFDIEWDPPKVGLKDKVLFPILGRQYGEALEAGEITLAREGGALLIRYYEHRLPAAPRTWISVLEPALERLGLAEGDPARMEYESVLFALKNLPRGGALSDEERRERAREKEVVKRRIAALCEGDAAVRAAIDGEIARIDGAPSRASCSMLFVTHAGLTLRREDPALFLEGDYVAIDGGPHVVAFARRLGSSAPAGDRPRDEPSRAASGARAVIAIVPRLTTRIVGPERFAVGDAWGDRTIALPVQGRLRDAFTGATLDASAGPVALADVLATLPVALLVSA